MTRVQSKVVGHYEVEEMPGGKDYRWVPPRALVECDCGRVVEVDASRPRCPGCGESHADIVREVAGRRATEDDLRPWGREYERWKDWDQGHAEREAWLEQRSLD